MHFEILVEDMSGSILLESLMKKILMTVEEGHSLRSTLTKGLEEFLEI